MTKEKVLNNAMAIGSENSLMLKEECDLIYNWVLENYAGGNILEIGVFKGRTSYIISQAIKDKIGESKHFIVDVFNDSANETGIKAGDLEWIIPPHTKEEFLENVGDLANQMVILEGYSMDNEITKEIMHNKFDFVFLDGDHRFPTLFLEHCMVNEVCDKIIGHDYGHPQVCESVDLFCKRNDYTVEKMNEGYGLYEIIKT